MKKSKLFSVIAILVLAIFGYTAYAADFTSGQTQQIQNIIATNETFGF